MSDLELVIFDCDGMLVDSEVISNSVLARALTAEGLPTTLAQARREYQGLLLSEVVQRAQQGLGRALADDWVEQFEQFERDRTEAFHRELEPVPGTTSTVQRINKGRRHSGLCRLAGRSPEDANDTRPDRTALPLSR